MKNINNLRIGQEVYYNGILFNIMSICYPSPQPKPELDMKWLVELSCGFVPFDDVDILEFNRQDMIEFAVWLQENDKQENVEQFFHYTDEDMLNYWLDIKNEK